MYKIKEIPKKERPRERLKEVGVENLSDKELKLDISISKLIVFVQGKNVTDLKVTNDNGDVGTYVSSASTKYGTKGCGNYKSVADKSLQGMMVTYTDCLAGDYKIDYKGKASSVEVYYEPDADLSFVFTDSSGNLVDPNALYEGDYKVSFGMVDAKTDEFISSELLGSPHYEGTYTINGKQETFSSDGMKGEVPISLKMNDTFSADLTVTYLSGYTIKKNSTDFGWPESGISVAPRPAGDLKIKISDGQKYYSLQDLKEGKPYKAEVYYQDKLLKGKELEMITCQHPLYDRESLIILGDHVTADAGTGCVHTAPGFGMDDFMVGQKYGLDVYCNVDAHGCMMEDCGEWLAGQYVEDANKTVTKTLYLDDVQDGRRGSVTFTDSGNVKSSISSVAGESPVMTGKTSHINVGFKLEWGTFGSTAN